MTPNNVAKDCKVSDHNRVVLNKITMFKILSFHLGDKIVLNIPSITDVGYVNLSNTLNSCTTQQILLTKQVDQVIETSCYVIHNTRPRWIGRTKGLLYGCRVDPP